MKKIYSLVYIAGTALAKRDKLGIHCHIEELCLHLFDEIISATLLPKLRKTEHLESARIIIEKIKHLVRLENEMKIIGEKNYILIESELIEASKMANGWLKFVTQNPPK